MSYSFSPKIVTDGLVLYLDAANIKSYSGSGTDWNDLSRETNNGTLINGPIFDNGNKGNIIFDGVNDYVNTDFIPSIGTGDITYDIWFKTNTAQTGALINDRSASAAQFTLAICTNGVSGSPLIGSNLLVYSYDNIIDRGFETTETWTDNVWHNVVGVHTSTTDKLYVDGILRGSVTTSSLNINNSTKLRIGALGDGVNIYPNWYFNGSISSTKVYNKALTDSEVLQNYNTLKHRFDYPENISIVTDQLTLNLDAGNSTSYPGLGSIWYDISGNNYDASLINSPTFDPLNGGSIVFDGINDYGTIPYNSNFNLSSTDYTLEGWFNSNSFASAQTLISKDTFGANFDWALLILNSTTLRISSNGTATNVTATVPTMSTGQWYHFVITSISGVIRIYLNSVLYQTGSMSTSNNSQVQVTLGCYSWNNPGGFINGKIPILRIYRKGLTNSEVLQNYNAVKGRFGL